MRTASGTRLHGPHHHRGPDDTLLARCLAPPPLAGQPRLPTPQARAAASCPSPRQMSSPQADALPGDQSAGKAVAESRSGYSHVPLYLGRSACVGRNEASTPARERGPLASTHVALSWGTSSRFLSQPPESAQSSEAMEHRSFFHRLLDAVPSPPNPRRGSSPSRISPEGPRCGPGPCGPAAWCPGGGGAPGMDRRSGGSHTSFSLSFFLVNLPDYLLIFFLSYSADIMCTLWLSLVLGF